MQRRVLRMGHPVLRRVAEPVLEFATDALHALIDDLWETMQAYRGIGLAAPQVGESRRIVVFGMESHPRDPEIPPIPRTVLINPEIVPLDGATENGWEACLSVPGLRGLVPRYTRIRYAGFDATGARIEREVEGYHARVVQHECDHLDGILYPQRMADLASLGFEEELAAALTGLPDEGSESARRQVDLESGRG
jgi:peptide deformylase